MTLAAALTADLLARLEATGAQRVDPAILQPAETLLDLYGEDIRARAYVTQDPALGEMMLRPDFTVPVVQAHMAHGAEPARYCYAGPVFRKQDRGGAREYLQVGYEVFARDTPPARDAEVFALFARLLDGKPVQAVTGDMGILRAGVQALELPPRRRAALLRHLWRPARFRALLERMAGQGPLASARAALVADLRKAPARDLIAQAGQHAGLRSEAEIAARIEALLADADTPPLSQADLARLDALLTLKAPARAALAQMRAMGWAALAPALSLFEARLDALDAAGTDTETLAFEASFGRTNMEYYDGFVFGFVAQGRNLPPIATGGRYDALTAILGQGRAIPAVGGVIRPEALLALGDTC